MMQSIDTRFDALVIGSGCAGSIAVKELTERGLDVLLLEAGSDLTEEDFDPGPAKPPKGLTMDVWARVRAMLAGQHVQAQRMLFKENANRFLVNDRQNPYSTSHDSPYLWIRARRLGGRMNAYSRAVQRMSDVDFKAASQDGFGQDWPIAYADLEPWYDRVEEFLGIYGSKDGLSHPPDGKYVGEAKLTAVEKEFKHKVEERWPERKVIPWRYAAPNLERIPLGILAAQKTGRLTLRTDAVVSKITSDEQTGLVDGAIFIDRVTKREYRASADVVVLCASAIESARLLLNSGSSRHPNGLANSSDLVGRYLMDHTVTRAICDVPHFPGHFEEPDSAPKDDYYNAAGGIVIPRFQNMGPSPDAGFLRGFGFQGLGARFPVPEGEPAAFALGGTGEMLPMFDNRITLHPRRKDAWGVPIAHIRCAIGDNDRVIIHQQVAALREMLEHAGYRIHFLGSILGLDPRYTWKKLSPLERLVFPLGFRMVMRLGQGIHECGGARMGENARTSVVNRVNQAWDVPNLFIPDASSFASNSTVGPSLTIMALAARAAAFIADVHGRGDLVKPTQAA